MKKRFAAGLIAGTLSLVLLAGCGSSDSTSAGAGKYASDTMAESAVEYGDYDYDYEEAYAPSDSVSMGESAESVEVTESANSKRKLIRTVYLDVETYDFDTLTGAVSQKVNALGGYIESSNVDGNNSSHSRSASYTLRIPRANADAFIDTIGEKGNVTHQSENMEDVTLQYTDINSRKEALKTEYARLEELIKNADEIEELIYIENRMTEVRYEIESIESQIRSYDNLVDYSTIHLSISEVQEYTEPEPVQVTLGTRIKNSFTGAIENISDILQGLLVVLAALIPYLIFIALIVLIVAVIVWLIRKVINKINPPEKKQAKAQEKAMKKSYTQRPPYPQAPQAPQGNVPAAPMPQQPPVMNAGTEGKADER